jgi:hypothetical protein
MKESHAVRPFFISRQKMMKRLAKGTTWKVCPNAQGNPTQVEIQSRHHPASCKRALSTASLLIRDGGRFFSFFNDDFAPPPASTTLAMQHNGKYIETYYKLITDPTK